MNISDYKDYEVEDFLEDEHFRKWVLTQDTSLEFFWEAYLRKYPHQKDKMEETRDLILDTHHFFHQQVENLPIPDDDFGARLRKEMKTNNPIAPSKTNYRIPLIRTLAAACILLLTISTVLYFYPCLLYTSPSPRDQRGSRMPSSA